MKKPNPSSKKDSQAKKEPYIPPEMKKHESIKIIQGTGGGSGGSSSCYLYYTSLYYYY
ncbi:MAG: hypothetical protein ACETWK_03685 [Candidatus Aminicenantaceae bacterium]